MPTASSKARRVPNDAASFNHRMARLSTGHTYHFVDEYAGSSLDASNALAILCVHGFPDFWYGWRHQIGPWVDRGWRVIVPDMLGYGATDKPSQIQKYTSRSLAADLSALLDFLNISKAVIIGHDWGSYVVWRFGLWHPERCHALVNLSIPYHPPGSEYISLEKQVELFPNYGYQLYFSNPDSTREIENKLETFLAIIYQMPGSSTKYSMVKRDEMQLMMKSPSFILSWSDAQSPSLRPREIQHILDTFKKSGMNGPLNYYRTTKYRYNEEHEANLPAKLLRNMPSLFIYGTKDHTCSQSSVKRMSRYIPQLEMVVLEGSGHWLMVEAGEAVTNAVINFISSTITVPSKL